MRNGKQLQIRDYFVPVCVRVQRKERMEWKIPKGNGPELIKLCSLCAMCQEWCVYPLWVGRRAEYAVWHPSGAGTALKLDWPTFTGHIVCLPSSV